MHADYKVCVERWWPFAGAGKQTTNNSGKGKMEKWKKDISSAVPEQRTVTSMLPVNTLIKMGIFFKGACSSAQSQCVPPKN